jgi:hypothetical protein
MAEDTGSEVPEGAAVFPLIPPELGINPLLLAALHATIFLAGSEDDIVHPEAADEAVQYIAGYFQRLEGPALAKVREDMACLVAYARQERWSKQVVRALKSFLADLGLND